MSKSIREIYNSLKERDETVIFQVKTRKTLNKILEELEEVDEWIWWDTYKKIPVKNVYLFVGKWRLGSVGIFPYHCIDCYGGYRFDDFLVDWKSTPSMQYDQKRNLDKVIDIFDKYREDIKISRKTYEEVSYQ
mgnify:FL=1